MHAENVAMNHAPMYTVSAISKLKAQYTKSGIK
jgi:hypothetical protein